MVKCDLGFSNENEDENGYEYEYEYEYGGQFDLGQSNLSLFYFGKIFVTFFI